MTTAPTPRPAFHAVEPLEARIAPATIYAVDAANHLLTFESDEPGTATSLAITGLGAGQRVADLDIRPATGELYLLTIEDTAGPDTGRIYKVNPATGAATQVGAAAFSTTLTDGAGYGLDFNPVADRLRIVNSANESLRVNPDNGALAGTDAVLTFTAPAVGPVIDVAYDRNGSDATLTTLFGIDAGGDRLVLIGGVNGSPSPNLGAVTAVGALGVGDVVGVAGFDVQNATGTAYAALQVGAATGLYTVNLTTGAATLVGTVGSGAAITGLAVAMPGVKLIGARTATFTDVDGETATVRVSKGTLGAGDFLFATRLNGGSQLLQLNLSDDGTEFEGANVNITISRRVPGGDGQVHVGYLNATGHDLGSVVVRGDLAQLDAGNATTTTPGLRALRVNSMGRFGTDTQAPVSTSLQSDILGPLSSLFVAGDLVGANLTVSGLAAGTIGAVTIRGSLVGTGDFQSGSINSDGDIGEILIGQNVEGGTGDLSGSIFSFGKIGLLTITGALLGNTGVTSGNVTATDDIGGVKIGGDVRGDGGIGSGALVTTGGKIGFVSIGGSLSGGRGNDSGEILATGGDIGRISIRRDFIGGSITGADFSVSSTGYIESLGRIGSIFIGGSFIAGTDTSTGGDLTSSGSIRAGDDIGTLTVRGNIVGNADSIATIVARGRDVPTGSADLAIGRISVSGRIEYASILAGYDRNLVGVNADAQVGSVRVAGDWVATSLVAGVDAGADLLFGTADDALLSGVGVKDNAATIARIASVSILGSALGTPEAIGSADHFGLVAEQVGVVRSRGTVIPHPVGAGNSNVAIGSTGDFRIFEV